MTIYSKGPSTEGDLTLISSMNVDQIVGPPHIQRGKQCDFINSVNNSKIKKKSFNFYGNLVKATVINT